MATRKRTVGIDARGRRYTEIGRKVTSSGKTGTHRFLLGTDEAKATERAARLKEFWEQNVLAFGPDVTWNSLTLDIGSQIAQGSASITLADRHSRPPEEFARWFNRVAATYPSLIFVPDSIESYARGAERNRELVASEVEKVTRVAKRVGKLTQIDVECQTSGSLHQALDDYVAAIHTEGVRLESGELKPSQVTRLERVARFKAAHSNMREAHDHHQQQFDVVVSADNSITHLLSDDDLLLALRQIHDCTRPGGGCLLTVRDYDQEERGTGLLKPYGVREEDCKRYLIFQVWDFVDQVYDMAMYFVVDNGVSEPATHVMRTRYNAVGTDHLLALMQEAGFVSTERIDGQYYQPVLIGNREVETTKTV